MGEQALPGAYAGLLELVTRYLDGQSSESEHRFLNDRLSESAGARDLFVRVVRLHGLLIERAPRVATMDEAEALFRGLDHGVSAHEPMDDAGPGHGVQESEKSAPSQAHTLPPRRVPWRLAAIIVLPLLLGLGLVWLLYPQVPAAMLASSVNAQWDDPNGTLTAGQPLPRGPVILKQGVAEIRFASGVSMIVEAPAHFRITSANAAELTLGKLIAVVPASAHGFAVQTASARIVDLGTEFGVSVGPDGATTAVEVFKGQVRAEGRGGPAATEGSILTQGQAATVSATAVVLDPTGAKPQRFVRSIRDEVGSLDVADLVSGGDGTTTRRGTAINYIAARAGVFPAIGDYQGDYIYHRIADLPAVDGCFIPEGSRGPVQVDSIGHTFAFPATNNASHNHIWAGGPIPTAPKFQPASTVLGGVDYARSGHGLLFMSANKGLTLDLAAIRRLHLAQQVKRFQCTVGNSYGSGRDETRQHPHADVYVIVDGGIRFEQRNFLNTEGPFHVDVPIGAADRFLTLAATDGGDGIGGDGIIWGDPLLELVSGPDAGQAN